MNNSSIIVTYYEKEKMLKRKSVNVGRKKNGTSKRSNVASSTAKEIIEIGCGDDDDNDDSPNKVPLASEFNRRVLRGGRGGGGDLSTSSSSKLTATTTTTTSSRCSKKKGRNCDNDDCDVGIERVSEKESFIRRDEKNGKIILPGGYARRLHDEMPDNVNYNVRAYLDALFGGIMLQASVVSDNLRAIPTVVSVALGYNNIYFKNVEMRKTNVIMPEPIWYSIDLADNALTLYVDESMYNEYCSVLSDVPVTWCGGALRVDRYNPLKTDRRLVSEMDSAKIKCAVACDHVAQHIIHELMNPDYSERAELHENWTRYGTTLHSMIDLELVLSNECASSSLSGIGNGGGGGNLFGSGGGGYTNNGRFIAMISTPSVVNFNNTVGCGGGGGVGRGVNF